MYVKYSKANIHTFTAAATGVQGAATSSVVLKPGLNQIDPKDWAKIKDHPHAVQMLEDGVLEVVGGEKDKAEDLVKMDAKKAVKMVKETLDHLCLVKWYAAEEREDVKAAIKAQLESLNMQVDGKPLVIDKKGK